jgi:spore coat protein U-like protein
MRIIFLFLSLCFFFLHNAEATCIGLGCTCNAGASTMNFGNYNPLSGAALTTTATVTVTCQALVLNAAVAYDVTFSAGISGSAANRRFNNSNTLNYNIYNSGTYASVLGDGNSGTSKFTNSYILALLTPKVDNFTIYGRIPAQSAAIPGSYSDQITISVIF